MMTKTVKAPKVTVLMPVYNGEKYLSEAIESILTQTFTDFEFLIINDGSSDKSESIIKSYTDSRIRFISNKKNRKLIYTLNRGVKLAKGEYIVRMDADDISLPERIKKQVSFMDLNPDIGICGTKVKVIDGEKEITSNVITDPKLISCNLLFKCSLAHPSVIIRKDCLEKHNLFYDNNFPHAEDYKLWQTASKLFSITNINEVLCIYRIHPSSICALNSKEQINSRNLVDNESFLALGIKASLYEHEIHNSIRFHRFKKSKEFINDVELWLVKLKKANRKIKLYSVTHFEETLFEYWFNACYETTSLGAWILFKLVKSNLFISYNINKLKIIKMLIKCLLKK